MQEEHQAALELMDNSPVVSVTMLGEPWRGKTWRTSFLRMACFVERSSAYYPYGHHIPHNLWVV